ncbi:hypothetical protein KID03_02485 [bacterium]|uniref:Uncharacterized protein n=1 Tax=Candidatus Scatenecus faecavium TaxID=2840915 RepID=A0A9D1FWL9_9BACT|nr:hypothetical protein [bacterium]HIS82771.1 hypothetical protein [Candidatus Scatenecus faecavium]
MKIYPVRNLSQNSFQSKLPAPPKLPSKTRQFFEGVSVAAITSIPMFVYLYLAGLYEKIRSSKGSD